MNAELKYNAPAFSLRELITLETSVSQTLCRRWKWRNDSPYWRESVRNTIAALRKLKQAKVAR